MQADSWWDRVTWAYRVRWVVFTCDTVLLVVVRIAVTRWQPDTLHDVLVLSSLDLPGTRNPALQPSICAATRSVLPVPGSRRRCRQPAPKDRR